MPLHARQIQIEQDYTNRGIQKSLEQWATEVEAGRLADTQGGRAVVSRVYKDIAADLEDECTRSTRGMGGKYRKLITEAGYEVCAVIALRQVLNTLGSVRKRNERVRSALVQDFITSTGAAVEAEWLFGNMYKAAPGYMIRVREHLDQGNTVQQHHRRATMRASAHNLGLSHIMWGNSERIGVGRILVESIVRVGLVESEKEARGRGQESVVLVPSEALEARLEQMAKEVRAFMFYPPMIVPPKPHTRDTLFSGASYLTDELAHHCGTIRVRTRKREHREYILDNISDTALAAANKAASTGYKIDTETANVIRGRVREGVHNGVAGLPGTGEIPRPAYPLPADWNRDDEKLQAAHMLWKSEARRVYRDNLIRKGHLRDFSQTMQYLREFGDTTLYFPTYFDWRGRLYFRSRVNPQGTDVVKALLQFAEAKRLGERGLFWLKVHVATCYGFDKKAPEARAAWVDENMHLIKQAVLQDVDSEFFRGADSHWCFYVAARDLVQALALPDPREHYSRIPVAMDATCSGLQHLSALFRDSVGGRYTNLLPNDGVEKEDIYKGVAGAAMARVVEDTENPEQSLYWQEHGVARDMAKRPVMTYVYSATLISCAEYVSCSMVDKGMQGLENYPIFNLACYVSKHLRTSLEGLVPIAAQGMRFLRKCAKSMPKDQAMRWVTPAGFPVVHQYAHCSEVRVDLPALGVRVNVRRFNEDLIQRNECMNGIAPNFVHSLDSAHLVRTLASTGISITPIHDSFATHPSDVDEMHKVLRSEFVSMYTDHDPVKELMRNLPEDANVLPPKRGDLDIQAVADSVFFMC